MVGIAAMAWGTTAFAGTHELQRCQLKSQRDATAVPSGPIRSNIESMARDLPSGSRRFGSTLLHRVSRRMRPS